MRAFPNGSGMWFSPMERTYRVRVSREARSVSFLLRAFDESDACLQCQWNIPLWTVESVELLHGDRQQTLLAIRALRAMRAAFAGLFGVTSARLAVLPARGNTLLPDACKGAQGKGHQQWA